jgi:hypothetical protein
MCDFPFPRLMTPEDKFDLSNSKMSHQPSSRPRSGQIDHVEDVDHNVVETTEPTGLQTTSLMTLRSFLICNCPPGPLGM